MKPKLTNGNGNEEIDEMIEHELVWTAYGWELVPVTDNVNLAVLPGKEETLFPTNTSAETKEEIIKDDNEQKKEQKKIQKRGSIKHHQKDATVNQSHDNSPETNSTVPPPEEKVKNFQRKRPTSIDITPPPDSLSPLQPPLLLMITPQDGKEYQSQGHSPHARSTSPGSIMGENMASLESLAESQKRMSYTLQVPTADSQTIRRLSAQMPSKTSHDVENRQKLMRYIFRDCPEKLEMENPPVKTPRRRIQPFDIKKFAEIDNYAAKAPRDAERDFEEIVEYLSARTTNDLHTTRAIYHYITTRTLEDLPPESALPDFTPMAIYSFIKKGFSSFYTLLFEILCKFANIPCVTIEGWVKPRTFAPGDRLETRIHSWNAAYINKNWYLFDVVFGSIEMESRPGSQRSSRSSSLKEINPADTSMQILSELSHDPNAMHVNPNGLIVPAIVAQSTPTFNKGVRFSIPRSSISSSHSRDGTRVFGIHEDHYFCVVPEDFIFSHFPFDEKWQLLQCPPLSKRGFERLALLRDDFFMFGLNVVEESFFRTTIVTPDEKIKFTFRLPIRYELEFHVVLRCTKGALVDQKLNPKNFCLIYKDQAKITIEIRPLRAGHYRFQILCRHRPAEDSDIDPSILHFTEVALYRIVSTMTRPAHSHKDHAKKRHGKKSKQADDSNLQMHGTGDTVLGPSTNEVNELKIGYISHESGYLRTSEPKLTFNLHYEEPLQFKFHLRFKEQDIEADAIRLVHGRMQANEVLTLELTTTFLRGPGEYFLEMSARLVTFAKIEEDPPQSEKSDDEELFEDFPRLMHPLANKGMWRTFASYVIEVCDIPKHVQPETHGSFGINTMVKDSIFHPETDIDGVIVTRESTRRITFNVDEEISDKLQLQLFYEGNNGEMIAQDTLLLYGAEKKGSVFADLTFMNQGFYRLDVSSKEPLGEALLACQIEVEESGQKLISPLQVSQSEAHKSGSLKDHQEQSSEKNIALMSYSIEYKGPDVTNETVQAKEFPRRQTGWSSSCCLHFPKSRYLIPLKIVAFDVTVPWASAVYIYGNSLTSLDPITKETAQEIIGRRVKDDEIEGRFRSHILVGMHNEVINMVAQPKDDNGLISVLQFYVDFNKLDMKDVDEMGEAQKKVEDAIERAWHHAGEVNSLEKEVNSLEEKGIRDTDGLYFQAKQLIPFFRIREDLIRATSQSDFEGLATQIQLVKQHGYESRLTLELPRAKKLYSQMMQRRHLSQRKCVLNQNCVSELRRYNNPQWAVQRILVATLIFLNYPISKTQHWEFIQTEMGKSGKQSIVHRLRTFNHKKTPIKAQDLETAKEILSEFSRDEVLDLNSSICAFYDWVVKAISKIESEDTEKPTEKTKSPRTPREMDSNKKPVKYDPETVAQAVSTSRPISAVSITHRRPASQASTARPKNQNFSQQSSSSKEEAHPAFDNSDINITYPTDDECGEDTNANSSKNFLGAKFHSQVQQGFSSPRVSKDKISSKTKSETITSPPDSPKKGQLRSSKDSIHSTGSEKENKVPKANDTKPTSYNLARIPSISIDYNVSANNSQSSSPRRT